MKKETKQKRGYGVTAERGFRRETERENRFQWRIGLTARFRKSNGKKEPGNIGKLRALGK